MISIKRNVVELEQFYELQRATLECYQAAVDTAAQYAVEIDSEITPPHRQQLQLLAGRIGDAKDSGDLEQLRSAFRNELRDYRDKAANRLNTLRLEIESNAKTLQQILTSMSSDADDHEVRLRLQVKRLRGICQQPEAAAVRQAVEAATNSLEECVEQIKKQNQITVAQFLVEIQLLHKRIDTLQAAASVDELSRMFNRRGMESRIKAAAAEGLPFCLVLLKVANFASIERQYPRRLVDDLVGAFSKRMRNQLKADAVMGRWDTNEFAVLLSGDKSRGIQLSKQLTQYLAGTYVCMQEGRPHRVFVQVSAGVVDSVNGDDGQRVIQRAADFLSST